MVAIDACIVFIAFSWSAVIDACIVPIAPVMAWPSIMPDRPVIPWPPVIMGRPSVMPEPPGPVKVRSGRNSKTMSGDKLNTLFDLAAFAAQHGMIWVGLDLYPGWHTKASTPDELNRLGSWFGAMSQANSDESPDVVPPPSDLATGEHLGRRVAEIAVVFSRGRQATTLMA